MTAREAIDKADSLKPNQFQDDMKLDWLNTLDAQIHEDVLMTHEPVPEEPFVPHKMDDELIAKFPYDELYVDYIRMRCDEANEETARYNNSVTIFQAKYEAYCKHVNKTQMPVFTSKFRLW